jgi:hypothetical protein
MALVKYLGAKDRKTTVFAPGVVWDGHNDVKEVPSKQAMDLVDKADIFQLVDADPVAPIEEVDENEHIEEDDTQKPPLVDLNAMDVKGLRDYAMSNFGHKFGGRTGEKKMREVIVSLMNKG